MRDEIRSERNASNADLVILFSGGRDSSLAVCKLASHEKNLILMNCLNGTTIGTDVIQTRYRDLKERFPSRIKDFVQVPIFGLFRTLAISQLERDLKCYKTCLVCLGCKMAAHTHAIIFCIENDIKVIADGYNQYQSGDFMEQRPEAIEIMKNFSAEYGILYINPVYDYKNKKEVKYALYDYGISTKSLEGTCIFGDSYSTPDRKDIISYITERLQICRNFIKERTAPGIIYSFPP